jgi:hypothetical protein
MAAEQPATAHPIGGTHTITEHPCNIYIYILKKKRFLNLLPKQKLVLCTVLTASITIGISLALDFSITS